MLLALMVSLAVAAPAPAPGRAPSIATASDDEPRIKVWLNHDDYRRGDKARVNVKVAEDGYLIVLRADAEGRVRVLFPLDPSDDAFGRGGETIEVRGRGDREAFYIDEREGTGLVLAARSAVPFKFDEFVRGDHWDYRVLDARQAGDDKEAALLDIVQRMTPDGHFDYDDVKYYVSSQQAYYDYYPSTLSVGFGWGWPYRYSYFSSCYDSFYYDPFYCGGFAQPYYYNPFFYGYYSPFRYRPYIYPRVFIGTSPYIYGGGVVYFNEPHSLFVNRLNGTGRGFAFKDPVGTNVGLGGIGPRYRTPGDPGVGFVSRTGGPSTPIRQRPPTGGDGSVGSGSGGSTGRDHNDRPDGRGTPRSRPADPGDHSRDGQQARPDRPDRPAERPSPGRQPESRDNGGSVDRSRERPAERPSAPAPAPAPERSRDPAPSSAPRSRPPSSDYRSYSAPAPRMERSAPVSRGWGGGGGGGGSRSSGGGGGGGGGGSRGGGGGGGGGSRGGGGGGGSRGGGGHRGH
jgi:Domain of unknown function (DUF4384)